MDRHSSRRVSFSDDPIPLEIVQAAQDSACKDADEGSESEVASVRSHASSIDSGKGSSDQGVAYDIQQGADFLSKYDHVVDVDDRLEILASAKNAKARRHATAGCFSNWASSCRERVQPALRTVRSWIKISDSTADILEIILIYGGILLTVALFSLPVVIHFVGPAAEVCNLMFFSLVRKRECIFYNEGKREKINKYLCRCTRRKDPKLCIILDLSFLPMQEYINIYIIDVNISNVSYVKSYSYCL